MSDMLKLLLPVIVTHVVVLTLIIVVVRRVLLGDSKRAVARVRDVETEIRKKESRIRQQIEEHEKEFEQKKAVAEEELRQHKATADKELAATRDKMLGDARQEAERLMEQARRNEEKLRQQIAQDMEEKAVVYAGQVVSMVLTDRMAEAVDRVFTDELLDAVEQIDAESISVDASSVSFTAARPLTPEQRQRLQALLHDKFGLDTAVEETVQEDLVAGLHFKLGSLEIDGSLRNRMAEAVEEVKKSTRG